MTMLRIKIKVNAFAFVSRVLSSTAFYLTLWELLPTYPSDFVTLGQL